MEQVRTVTREFPTGEQAVLHLEGRSGAVVIEGRDADRIVVEAVIRTSDELAAEADETADLVARGMEQDGHRVIVRAPSLGERRHGWHGLFRQSTRIDYTARVPVSSAVRALSRSGSIDIRHVHGRVHGEAMSGRLGIEDVRGEVAAGSRSGSVLIERVEGDVTVDARSGRVRVNDIKGNVELEARSGSIEVAGVSGNVRIASSAGGVTLADIGGRLQVRTKAGGVRYRGPVNADMSIEAHAGSILLAVDPDTPFFIDAESHVGSVRSDLPPRSGGGDAREGPKVRLRTTAGSIRLTRAD